MKSILDLEFALILDDLTPVVLGEGLVNPMGIHLAYGILDVLVDLCLGLQRV